MSVSAGDDDFDDVVLVGGVEAEGAGGVFQRKPVADDGPHVHATGSNEPDGARIGVSHAAGEQQGESFAAGGDVGELKMVAIGYADEHDASAGSDKLDGLLRGVAGPGGFEDDIGVLERRAERFAAEFLGEFLPPRERIADKHTARASEADGLDEAEADAAAAENGDCVTFVDFGETGDVKSDAEGFEHDAVGVVKRARQRETVYGGHAHPLAEAAVVRPEAAEADARTEVGIAFKTTVAAFAGYGGVNGDAYAGFEFDAGASALDDTGEFVAEDQRGTQRCVADASVLVGVEVAAADAGGGYAE